MPSPRAQQRTAQHRRDLIRLAATIGAQVNRAALMADTTDIDEWWRKASPAVIRIVAQGHDVAAALARRYLGQHAELEGVRLQPARLVANVQEIATSLHVTGPVAFKTNMRISADPAVARRVMGQALAGSAQRLTVNGGRATVLGTFRESDEIVGWRRVGTGSCAFCAMLLSRGAVYTREATVDFQAHDRCGCSPEPLYEREPEPESVQKLQEQWAEATAGTSGKEAIRAWRDYLAEKASA